MATRSRSASVGCSLAVVCDFVSAAPVVRNRPSPARSPPRPRRRLLHRSPTPPEASPAEPAVRTTAVLKKDSPVFVRPGALEPMQTILGGTRVTVREQVDDWLMIEFRDAKWGVRVGYVLRENSNGDGRTAGPPLTPLLSLLEHVRGPPDVRLTARSACRPTPESAERSTSRPSRCSPAPRCARTSRPNGSARPLAQVSPGPRSSP